MELPRQPVTLMHDDPIRIFYGLVLQGIGVGVGWCKSDLVVDLYVGLYACMYGCIIPTIHNPHVCTLTLTLTLTLRTV